jgi:hypothetical protein
VTAALLACMSELCAVHTASDSPSHEFLRTIYSIVKQRMPAFRKLFMVMRHSRVTERPVVFPIFSLLLEEA